MMSELIAKKFNSLKILRICFFAFFALFIASFFVMPFFEVEVVIAPMMILSWANIICVIIYFASFHPFKVSMTMLKKRGIENIADDINLQIPTLPTSQIYCGSKALFCKKPFVVIPYFEIAWVYLYERKSYGITIEKAVIVHTIDGKKFALKSNVDEFQWLLQNFVAVNSPNLIVGFGSQQKKRYFELYPNAKAAKDRVKMIRGIVLMCVGALLSIVGIVNKTIEGIGLVILLALFASGLLLFLLGKKK